MTERDGVDVVMASEVVALGNRASIRSRFRLSRIARVLPGLETKHAFARRAQNVRYFQRDFDLTPIGPLRRRPPRHQRRSFRRVSVEVRDFALRHVMPLAGGSSCGPTPERRDGGSLKNVAEGGDSEWGWGSPRAFAETNTQARRFSASRRRRPAGRPSSQGRSRYGSTKRDHPRRPFRRVRVRGWPIAARPGRKTSR